MQKKKQRKIKSRQSTRTMVPVSSPDNVQMRFKVLGPIFESDAPIGQIKHSDLIGPAMPTGYSAYKILKVGFSVNPLSYVEFVVRAKDPTAITNREKLTRQPDCITYRNLTGKPKVFWYKPLDAVARGWQDFTSSPNSGLVCVYNGQNDLIAGAAGYMGHWVYDVVLRGFSI